MSTIQNFKNFLRHGKQARVANSPPHADPTINAQNVHARHQRYDPYQQFGIHDPNVIERIVTEERESRAKMPRYPGLERYTLVEKMGDGAFSNVYRAKDNTGQFDDVAIKVVRKFEMNNKQVRSNQDLYSPHLFRTVHFTLLSNYHHMIVSRAFTNIASGLGRQCPSSGF